MASSKATVCTWGGLVQIFGIRFLVTEFSIQVQLHFHSIATIVRSLHLAKLAFESPNLPWCEEKLDRETRNVSPGSWPLLLHARNTYATLTHSA
jgi:hypothetical protein